MALKYEPSIAKLGHVHLTTPDLETSLSFFHDLIGLHITERSETKVYLRGNQEREHHSLVLEQGEKAKLEYVGWRVSRPEDLELFHDRLVANGNEVSWTEANEEDGVGRSLWCHTPAGHKMRLYYDVRKVEVPEADRAPGLNQPYRSRHHGCDVRRIDHVNLWTTEDPRVQHEWLTENLGFKMREYIETPEGRIAGWMSWTPQVHDVAVMAAAPTDPTPARFHHVAFFVDDASDLIRSAEIVAEAGISADQGPGRHGATQGEFLYVKDPGSGHRVEIFTNGYLIFDPDWEPIEWGIDDIKPALAQWGPTEYVPHAGPHPMDTTTEA